jgi:hypothetical protein
MRTKTLALSALLGMLGSASLVAQTNVYSINAVGYINVTLYPGYNIVTCPLICTPNNTVSNLFNNSAGAYQGSTKVGTPPKFPASLVYQFVDGTGFTGTDNTQPNNAGQNGWANGSFTLNPGQSVFYFNPLPIGSGSNMVATFVGTVPQGNNYNLTNALLPGFNLVGSIIPDSGDIITNTIMSLTNVTPTKDDQIYTFDPTYNSTNSAQGGYITEGTATWTAFNGWNGAGAFPDPYTFTVYNGFWYYNNSKTVTRNWVENFTINP